MGHVVHDREDLVVALLPSSQGREARPSQMVHPAQVSERNLGNVAVGRRGLDFVRVIEGIGEAEFDIDARRPGEVQGRIFVWVRRIVLPQVPVLVVDVHLYVEGIANLRAIPVPFRVDTIFELEVLGSRRCRYASRTC